MAQNGSAGSRFWGWEKRERGRNVWERGEKSGTGLGSTGDGEKKEESTTRQRLRGGEQKN